MKIIDRLKSIVGRFEHGINRDESVVFYPSYGFKEGEGDWKLEVRGTIFEEREILEHIPQLALPLAGVSSVDKFTDLLGRLVEDVDVQHFRVRSKAFLVDGESNEQFEIDLSGQINKIGESDSHGYFENVVTLSDDLAQTLLQQEDNPWVPFVARDNERKRCFTGKSQVLQPTGITVVSDIDDTIKDSNVPEITELIINTLFRPFEAVEGMADVYTEWHGQRASFIYLTNSPYQLYEPLTQFLQMSYPEGAYYMRRIEWKTVPLSIAKLIAADEDEGVRENPKKHNLIPILERFPERKFILVGDSTESDAEIYADLYLGQNFPDGFEAKPYSDRIAKIYIRDVNNSEKTHEAVRAVDAIKEKGEGIAMLFKEPGKIQDDARSVFQDQ